MNAMTLMRATRHIGAKELRLNLDSILRDQQHPYRVTLRNKPAVAILPDAQFMELLEILEELKTSGLLDRAIKKLREGKKKEHAWFWSEEWQKGEREVDAQIKAGKIKRFKSVKALFKELDG